MGEQVIHRFISDKQYDHSQFTSLSYFKFLPCKEERNPPSTSFPELLREGYSGVAKAMLVAVIVETSYLSGTLYPSLHLSQRYPIWRVWIVTFHHFTEAKSEILHGHMAYPTLQNRGFIQTYIFAMEYAKNSYNKVTHKNEWKVQSAITMTVIL